MECSTTVIWHRCTPASAGEALYRPMGERWAVDTIDKKEELIKLTLAVLMAPSDLRHVIEEDMAAKLQRLFSTLRSY